MTLYVVFDTKGAGRVLGVFDQRAVAEALVAQDPCYYQLHACALNELNQEVLRWLDDDGLQATLEGIVAGAGK